jgi:hypothetical protein
MLQELLEQCHRNKRNRGDYLLRESIKDEEAISFARQYTAVSTAIL